MHEISTLRGFEFRKNQNHVTLIFHAYAADTVLPIFFVTPNVARIPRQNYRTDFYVVCFTCRQFRFIAFLEA